MRLTKKNMTAAALMLLVAIPVFFSLTMVIRQKLLHIQREKKFENVQLQTVTVAAADIYWVKPGKEILLHGKLFDVKSYETKDNTISLLGFFDHKEDKLVQQIVNREKEKQRTGDPVNSSAKFLFLAMYNIRVDLNLERNWKLLSTQFYTFTEKIPFPPVSAVLQPPRLSTQQAA